MGLTLKQLAEIAGVSTSTASRALRDQPGISPATRARIHSLAAELGYRPNALGRALQRQSSGTIGLIVPSLVNHYFSSLATAVQREALAVGLHTIVLTSNEDPATLDALVRGLSQHSIDGLLCVPLEESRAAVEDVASAMPVVLIDRSLPGSALPAVTSDPVPGVSAAVELLARRELTPIGYLSGPLDTSTGRERLDALTAAVAAVGLPPQHIYHGGYQEEQGVQGAEALLRQGVRTLFAGDSMMTVGVLRACHGQGLRIPEDIAVVGFDPHPAFELQPRPITIIDQHADAMASLAFGLLLQLMEKGPPGGRRHLRTTTTLIERESTDTGGEE